MLQNHSSSGIVLQALDAVGVGFILRWITIQDAAFKVATQRALFLQSASCESNVRRHVRQMHATLLWRVRL